MGWCGGYVDTLTIVLFLLAFSGFEFKRICDAPEADPSTNLVGTNSSSAQYTCRPGYRFHSGDLLRSCDANGTWSGVQLVCAVDSILPKAYLVILIVGATIAVFLACIPYDFYRFRKRKKKVRDHQERLSLVTRIAPGHAKVVLETISNNQNQMGYTQSRRFGFKSLFSVFRFVGGKMRSSHGHADATNPVCADENNIDGDALPEKQSAAAEAPDSDGAKSSYVFSQQVSPSCPTDDAVDLCPFADDNGFDSIGPEVEGEISLMAEDGESRPRSSSPLVLDSNNGHEQVVPAKKGFQMFKKANEIFNRDSDSRKHASNIISNKTSSPSVCETLLSEPATVEVTSINKTMLLGPEDPPQDDTPTSKVGSPASSTSSPEVALLRKSCPKVEQIKTFHYPTGKSTVAYHSMPTISDIP